MVVEFTRNDIVQAFNHHLDLAEQYRAARNYRDAIEEYFQALPLTKYTGLITTGQIKQKIADCYYLLHDYKTAIKYYDETIAHYKDELIDSEYISVLIRKGVSMGQLGYYSKAIELYKKVAAFDSKEAKTKAYNNLGVLYWYLHRFTERECLDKALEYLTKALVLTDENYKKRKQGILRNMGMIYHALGKYGKALELFDNALSLVNDPLSQAQTCCEIAKTKIELGNFDEALELITNAQKILVKFKDFHEISNSIFILGLLYMKKGDISNAHSFLQTALFGFLEIEAYPEVVQTSLQLYKLFVAIDRSRAEVYYEQYKFYINYVDPYGE
ncbi:MAG: tetratricopeptide repeat protein [Halanaerobiales bacterium]|nr:tetratricopeptide repeat protein [Halanaerobiales bacterium]